MCNTGDHLTEHIPVALLSSPSLCAVSSGRHVALRGPAAAVPQFVLRKCDCKVNLLLLFLFSWVSLSGSAPPRRTALRRSSCSRRRTATLTPRGPRAPPPRPPAVCTEPFRVKRLLTESHCIACWTADNGTALSFYWSRCVWAKREAPPHI